VSDETGTPDTASGTTPDSVPERPLLRVVRGTPDAVELAALIAVVAASGGGDGDAPAPVRSAWAAPGRSVRGALPTGGWRASLAPR
jgi:hypothetical protein